LRKECPEDPRRAKGWAGEIIELALGANAGSKPEPDFIELGIELKTIPVNERGFPRQSTHVCAISSAECLGARWESSRARIKLARVLWMPILTAGSVPIPERRVGQAVLWRPNAAEEAQLRRDWEEHMEMIALGRGAAIAGEQGVYMQVRPKAASGRSRIAGVDNDGERTATLPLGFYLRPRFTAAILGKYYAAV
jgi:DNA mismatch repair protein MutH